MSAGSALSRHRPGSAVKARATARAEEPVTREEAKLDTETSCETIASNDATEVVALEPGDGEDLLPVECISALHHSCTGLQPAWNTSHLLSKFSTRRNVSLKCQLSPP